MFTMLAKDELCDQEVQIVVTRLNRDETYEGYCSACGGTVFGFFVEKTDNSEKQSVITPPS